MSDLDVLTAEKLYRTIEALENQPDHTDHYLFLPGWFPASQRAYADAWAKENGWAGAAYLTMPKRGRSVV